MLEVNTGCLHVFRSVILCICQNQLAVSHKLEISYSSKLHPVKLTDACQHEFVYLEFAILLSYFLNCLNHSLKTVRLRIKILKAFFKVF